MNIYVEVNYLIAKVLIKDLSTSCMTMCDHPVFDEVPYNVCVQIFRIL